MNVENFESSLAEMLPEQQTALRSCVKLTLQGDIPAHKLLGIQFDG